MKDHILTTLALLFCFGMVIMIEGYYGKFMYGNWRCGFAHCRIMVDNQR